MKTVLSRRLVRRSFTFGGRSSAGIWVVFRYVLPSLVTATVIASLLSAACMGIGFLTFAISTLTPLDNMGVMTMKMMSSTSITSTMGVTLMSATGGGALCLVAFSCFLVAIVCLHGTQGGVGRRSGRPAFPFDSTRQRSFVRSDAAAYRPYS